MHGPRETGGDTGRLVAVPALQGEGDGSFLLHLHPLHRPRLALESLDDVLALGMLHDAVDLAQAAADAILLFRDYTYQIDLLYRITTE
jgi:hypothetical protein